MQFAAIAGFPNSIVAIECTDIETQEPWEDDFLFFVNHRHNQSMQIICDVQMAMCMHPWINIVLNPST